MASPAAILQVFVNANTKVASAQLAAFDRQLSSVGKTSAATGAGMGKFTKGAAAAGAGVAAFGAAAVVMGKQLFELGQEFDNAYDTIRIRTSATGKELERLKRSFSDVTRTVPNDLADVGVAIADLNTRLGLTGKPLEAMARNMLELSNLTGGDLETNIRAVARAFVDWEVTIPKQINYLDGMFRVSQASGASIGELADQVQKFGSPLRQLGFDFRESVAMFASFERAGVNTTTMVPGLKLAISNLTRPTSDLAVQMQRLGIETGKPDVALRQIFKLLGSSSTLSQIEKTGLAMDVFGKRAGADMAEAIRQGRFELERFLRIFSDKRSDGIRQTALDTRDFSENMGTFGNRLKVLVRPAAMGVFNALTKISQILASPFVNKAIKSMGRIFKATFDAIAFAIRPTVKGVSGGFKFMAQAARSVAKAFRNIVSPIKGALSDVVSAVRSKFQSALNAATNFVNRIISVINLIPTVDINPIGGVRTSGFGEGSSQRGQAAGLQRGGVLTGGRASGDSIPAMLERGEYVLNRQAVKKIGVKRLNQLNFKNAPRFQKGGFIDTLTELPGDFVRPAVDAGTAALGLLMNGPGQFLKMLPKPNLPAPIKGVGPFVLRKAVEFIKRVATSPLKDNEWVDSHTYAVAKFLASKFSASISSSYRSPAENAAVGGVPNSSHTRGTPSNPGAFDFVPPSGGMQSFAGKNIAGITENMIHDVGSGLHNHIAFFQRGGSVGAVARMATGGEVVRQAAPILTRRGFDHKAAAGILGNAWGESSWNPGATGYGGGGLFGFTASPVSLADLQAYASSKGKPWTHVPTQIKFMLSHGQPTGMAMRGALNALDTIPATTEKFMTDWERPGIPRLDDRIQGAFMASDIMRKMKLGDAGKDKKQEKVKEAKEKARKKAKRKRIARKIARMAAKGLAFPGQSKLAEFEAGAEKLVEQIDLYDREATADWSPAGSDYDQTELSSLIAYYTDLLNNYIEQRNIVVAAVEVLQGRIAFWEAKIQATQNPGAVLVKNGEIIKPGKKWQIKGWQKAIANARSTIGSLGEKRLALEGLTGDGGAIGDTRFTLKELGATTSPTDTGAADSEIADLLRQQLQETQRALAISQAQMPIFQQFMPRFHQGGIVQGPNGAERPVMAQAGEGIFTRDQMRAMGSQNITVVIEDAAIDSNRIRVEVDGVIQDKVSTVRRQGSNRRFTTSR